MSKSLAPLATSRRFVWQRLRATIRFTSGQMRPICCGDPGQTLFGLSYASRSRSQLGNAGCARQFLQSLRSPIQSRTQYERNTRRAPIHAGLSQR
jgi:hypothetical protein